MMDHRMRRDIIYRLRWNILGTLENIEIAAGPHGEETFVPFVGSSYANESIAQPPLSRLSVRVGEFLDKRSFDYAEEEYRYRPPPELIISNHDDSPITMGQFITEVHAYLTRNMDEIKKVKGELYGQLVEQEDGTISNEVTYGRSYLPSDVKIFFRQIGVVGSDENVKISVALYAEGEAACSVDKFWSIQLRLAERYRQDRRPTSTLQ
ncbi:hypothetical protein K504DRAFT_367104 [Pleomassaria siparia CBS 279.74]|uniref:Uncharacterized protein n=1 Tax=Pleomassaria siparia CBS 279.74 TaxID=1314801 RepID=A0A6G1KN20_9PLEO|nr:hypothetical protein K504DRAFT_367104 [Pleomassaria siparia CBS 279.74]